MPVQGSLPPWLRGTLLRNLSGTFEAGRDAYRHWFDGLAHLHRFAIADGRVLYANRPLESDAYNTANAQQRIV